MGSSGPPPNERTSSGSGGRVLRVVVATVAVALQLIVAVPFTAAIGLVAPPWGVAMAWVMWFAAAGVLYVTARRRPLLSPVVPIVNAASLFLLIALGDQWFGWTA